MHNLRLAILMVAVFWAATTSAAAPSACMPTVTDGWLRLLPAKMPMLAGFGRVQNDCPMPITIVRIRSSAFESVELHETSMVNGISRMRALPEFTVAPGNAAILKPGGMHLMLIQPRRPLQAGGKIAIEFELSDGRVLLGEFEAKRAAP